MAEKEVTNDGAPSTTSEPPANSPSTSSQTEKPSTEGLDSLIEEKVKEAIARISPRASSGPRRESPRDVEDRLAEQVSTKVAEILGPIQEKLEKVGKTVEKPPKQLRKITRFMWGDE